MKRASFAFLIFVSLALFGCQKEDSLTAQKVNLKESGQASKNSEGKYIALKAFVAFKEPMFIISIDDEFWKNAKFTINDQYYTYFGGEIKKGKYLALPTKGFVKDDGTRFDSNQTMVRKLTIEADIPQGRGISSCSWEPGIPKAAGPLQAIVVHFDNDELHNLRIEEEKEQKVSWDRLTDSYQNQVINLAILEKARKQYRE